ncbi:MAG: DEAD/DEAH box helicase, partial [Deltaproteobacteria bacterium]|nr:DEAD/DEAH box helicase [Deltaproteobacteria bacterium]
MNLFPPDSFPCRPLTVLPGLGPARARDLLARGLSSCWDLLRLPPSSYQDRRRVSDLSEAAEGQEILFLGQKRGLSLAPSSRFLKAEMACGDLVANLWWFNALQHFQAELRKADFFHVYGRPQFRNGRWNLTHPEFWPAPSQDVPPSAIMGVFPAYDPLGGLSGPFRRKLVAQIVDDIGLAPPLFPPAVLAAHGLAQPASLLSTVHQPPAGARGRLPRPRESRAWRALSTLELAFWRLIILSAGPGPGPAGTPVDPPPAVAAAVAGLWDSLPFRPSPEQERVTREILSDLLAPRPMNRLLQGEVGSGKTAVAAALAVSCLAQGRQVALMAPTEILARQHHDFLGGLGLPVHFLTGREPQAARRKILASLASGAPSLAIGTQALASPGTVFADLGLAIIDEQHRFGVKQRLALRGKSPGVNLLSLSATPIPSSLATILYGDMDISSMAGILPGRSRALTTVFGPSQAAEARSRLADLVREGQQAFVVCPRIEAGDADPGRPEAARLFSVIRGLLPDHEAGLLHGRLAADERARAMADFRSGRLRVLVATSMVEVGVDVPAANVMLVEGADFFGLAQLHQLRGRVGRGGGQGHFLLVPS